MSCNYQAQAVCWWRGAHGQEGEKIELTQVVFGWWERKARKAFVSQWEQVSLLAWCTGIRWVFKAPGLAWVEKPHLLNEEGEENGQWTPSACSRALRILFACLPTLAWHHSLQPSKQQGLISGKPSFQNWICVQRHETSAWELKWPLEGVPRTSVAATLRKTSTLHFLPGQVSGN